MMMPQAKGVFADEQPVPPEADAMRQPSAPEASPVEAAPPEAAVEPMPPEQEAPQSVDPRMMELFALVVSRVRQALTKVAKDLDVALKADPVHGAVQFGTTALREVVMAAEKAGKKLPFDVIAASGMQIIKDIATIANEKGYLQDEGIEVFLKEAWQQSLSQYAKMDAKDGLLTTEQMQAVKEKVGGGMPGGEMPGGGKPSAAPPGGQARGVLSGA